MPDKFREGDHVRSNDGFEGTIVRMRNGQVRNRDGQYLMRRHDGRGHHGAYQDGGAPTDEWVYWWVKESNTELIVPIPTPAPSSQPEEVRGQVERIDRTIVAGGVTTIVTTTPIYARDGGRLLRTEITTERRNAAGEVTYSETVSHPAPPSLNHWPYTMTTGASTFPFSNPSIEIAGHFTPASDEPAQASKRVVATGIEVGRTMTTKEKIAEMSKLVVGHVLTPPGEGHGYNTTTAREIAAYDILAFTDSANNMMYRHRGHGDVHDSIMTIGAIDHGLVERLRGVGRGNLGWHQWIDARAKVGLVPNIHISPAFKTMREVDLYWDAMYIIVMEQPWARGIAEQPKLMSRSEILLERMNGL